MENKVRRFLVNGKRYATLRDLGAEEMACAQHLSVYGECRTNKARIQRLPTYRVEEHDIHENDVDFGKQFFKALRRLINR